MGEGRAAVVLQRADQRRSVGLVAGRVQESAAGIAAEVVAIRGDRGEFIENVSAQRAGIEDGATNLQYRAAVETVVVDAAAELPLTVLLITVRLALPSPSLSLLMPPPLPEAVELPLTVLLTIVSVALPEA